MRMADCKGSGLFSTETATPGTGPAYDSGETCPRIRRLCGKQTRPPRPPLVPHAPPGVVQAAWTRPAVAADARSIRDPGVRNHAPADAGGPGPAEVPRMAGPVSDVR